MTPFPYSMFGLSSAVYSPSGTAYTEQPARPSSQHPLQPAAQPRAPSPAPPAQFDRLALWYLCSKLAEAVGEPLGPLADVGYPTFVRLAGKARPPPDGHPFSRTDTALRERGRSGRATAPQISVGRPPEAQRMLVLGLLLKVVPAGIPAFFRLRLFPFLLRVGFPLFNAMAWGTGPVTGWLVGPNSQQPSEVDGQPLFSRVLVKRCRYLEASGCKSQCVNICKVPTQSFFTNECGLPLTMKPNFEDLSCELIFGQQPPELADDEAFSQPCFVGCAVAAADGRAAARAVGGGGGDAAPLGGGGLQRLRLAETAGDTFH